MMRAAGPYLHRESERASFSLSLCLSVLLCPHVSTHRASLYEGFQREGMRVRANASLGKVLPSCMYFIYVFLPPFPGKTSSGLFNLHRDY